MSIDTEHPESESTDDEMLAQRKILVELMKGERQMDWTVWPAFVYDSQCLTPEGKRVVRWAANTLNLTLGADFLQQAAAASAPHPIFSLGLWPANDVPQVYANLFQLAAQIELLRLKVGWSMVRDALRRDLRIDQWASSLLQLEVAGLGLKADWKIEFERPLPTGKRTDVILTKDSTKLLVETKAMLLSSNEHEADVFFNSMVGMLVDLAWKYGVRISDNIGSSLSPDVQMRWLQEIEMVAQAVARDGGAHVVPGPGQRQLEIVREATMPGIATLEGALVETNVGKRLIDQLIQKNEQYGNAGPAWVRLGDYAGLWQSTGLQGKPLSEKLEVLTPFLQRVLAVLPDLAGVILSPGKTPADNNSVEPLNTPIEKNGGIAISCPIPGGNRVRESMIVPQVGQFHQSARLFTDWYMQEGGWLDWALIRLGYPPFDALVHPSEQVKNPVGSP